MTEQSPDYLPQDAKPEALRLANVALPRYKIGYRSDEWGMGGSTLTGIPSPDGAWVRFEDAQVLQTGYASARLEIESLKARAQELMAQLDAVGAGGVEPLRRAKCLHQIAEPKQKPVAFGSAEEFSSSDDPHCKNGGKACIDCLMRGECLHQTVEPVPEAAQEPMFWVRLTDSGGYEGPLHRSSIEDVHKKSGAWTPLYTEPQPPAVEPVPTHWIESLPAIAREIFCNYPTKTQKEIDDVIEWFAASISVQMSDAKPPAIAQEPQSTEWVDKVMSQAQVFASAWSLIGGKFDRGGELENAEQQKAELRAMLYAAPQPPAVEPQPTPSNPGELKPDLANIDSPFNACMYQERCKRWRDAAARKQLTLEELADKWLSVRHIVHATDRQIAFARAIEAAHGITAPKPVWLPSDDTEGGAL